MKRLLMAVMVAVMLMCSVPGFAAEIGTAVSIEQTAISSSAALWYQDSVYTVIGIETVYEVIETETGSNTSSTSYKTVTVGTMEVYKYGKLIKTTYLYTY